MNLETRLRGQHPKLAVLISYAVKRESMWRDHHQKLDIELKVDTRTVELAMAFADFKVDVFAVVAVVVFDLEQAFIPPWDRQFFSQALQGFLAPCHLFMEIVFFKVTVIFEVTSV